MRILRCANASGKSLCHACTIGNIGSGHIATSNADCINIQPPTNDWSMLFTISDRSH